MGSFDNQKLEIEDLENGNYLLLEDLNYYPNARDIITVPKGFRTDFRSVPTCVDNIIPKIGDAGDKSSVLHDWLYGTKYFNWIGVCPSDLIVATDSQAKKNSDQMLLDAMNVLGVGYFKRYTIYWSVSLFGGSAWEEKTDVVVNANRLIYKQRLAMKAP